VKLSLRGPQRKYQQKFKQRQVVRCIIPLVGADGADLMGVENAFVQLLHPECVPAPIKPITRIGLLGFCARAGNGYAVAAVSQTMKSRRFIGIPTNRNKMPRGAQLLSTTTICCCWAF
jgi:hypothetical protein